MATVAFDAFFPEVVPECANAPQPLVVNAIRNACFDFCRESNWVSAVQDAEVYTANESTYELSAPSGSVVSCVLGLTIDGVTAIEPCTMDTLAATTPTWATATGTIRTYVQQAPNSITFVAVPDSSGTFVATVAYAPSRDSTTIDKGLYDYHLETIKHGALWKLKSMVGQLWSDPGSAEMHRVLFWQGVGQATIDRYRSNSRATSRIMLRPFA